MEQGDSAEITAVIVAARLKGEGWRYSMWWGGDGWGAENTHNQHFDFWRFDGWRPVVTVPLPAKATSQLRTPEGGYYTNRHMQEGPFYPNPRTVSGVTIVHDPRAKVASVRYERL